MGQCTFGETGWKVGGRPTKGMRPMNLGTGFRPIRLLVSLHLPKSYSLIPAAVLPAGIIGARGAAKMRVGGLKNGIHLVNSTDEADDIECED